jgi:hypothetical protein
MMPKKTSQSTIAVIAWRGITKAFSQLRILRAALPQEANQIGVLNGISVDDRGYVHTSEKPGLDCEVDWDLVNRLTRPGSKRGEANPVHIRQYQG